MQTLIFQGYFNILLVNNKHCIIDNSFVVPSNGIACVYKYVYPIRELSSFQLLLLGIIYLSNPLHSSHAEHVYLNQRDNMIGWLPW